MYPRADGANWPCLGVPALFVYGETTLPMHLRRLSGPAADEALPVEDDEMSLLPVMPPPATSLVRVRSCTSARIRPRRSANESSTAPMQKFWLRLCNRSTGASTAAPRVPRPDVPNARWRYIAIENVRQHHGKRRRHRTSKNARRTARM